MEETITIPGCGIWRKITFELRSFAKEEQKLQSTKSILKRDHLLINIKHPRLKPAQSLTI